MVGMSFPKTPKSSPIRDFEIRRSGTLCRVFGLLAVAGAFSLPGCAGEVLSDQERDEDTMGGDGDDSPGDGDGDRVGDGDGDVWMGDGDFYGDGDVRVCTDDFRYGIIATVFGIGSSNSDSFGAAPEPELPIAPPEDPVEPPPMGGADGGGGECAARVIAVEGDYEEELFCVPDGNGDSCSCYGAGERSGSYDVTAFYNDVVESQFVRVGHDGCHVNQMQLYFGVVR